MSVNSSAAALRGWRKILATLLPVVVAAINATVAGANVQVPESYDTVTLIAWLLSLITTYLPTIITAISSAYYVKKNVEQDAFHTDTSASIAIAQAKASGGVTDEPKKADSAVAVQTAAAPAPMSANSTEGKQVFYSMADADIMASEAEFELEKQNAFTPIALAYAFRSKVLNFDIANVRPSDRVKQAEELVRKAKELFDKAIEDYTGSTAPTWEEYANIPRLQFRYKRDYEKAHNLPCSNRTMEEINSLLNTMEDFVRYKAGRELIGNTPSEALLWNNIMAGGRQVNAFDVFEYAGSLVPSLPETTSKKSK